MRYLFRIILPCFIAATTACSDYNEPARTPVADCIVSQTALSTKETMRIDFTGIADQVVVFTGDAGHDYAKKSDSNTGFVVNKGLFTYSYLMPGTFHVVVLALTYDSFMGGGHQEAKYEFDVTVKDDVTEIGYIYSSITPNTYYAELVDEQDWLMCLPTYQLNPTNGREVKLNAVRQRLSFGIDSDSSRIYIDNEPYSSKAYYNLSVNHDIKVISNYGSERNYRLHMMIYPEFNSIKLGGVTAQLSRNAYWQNQLAYSVNLPDDVNPKQVCLDFELDTDVSLFADGEPVVSGSILDLTKDMSYTLVRQSAEKQSVFAISNIMFSYQ